MFSQQFVVVFCIVLLAPLAVPKSGDNVKSLSNDKEPKGASRGKINDGPVKHSRRKGGRSTLSWPAGPRETCWPRTVQCCIGAQGPMGPHGTPGQPGPQGLQGIQGVQGIQGAAGVPGIHGTNGMKGQKGKRGAKGMRGQCDCSDYADQLSSAPLATIAFSATMDQDMPVSSEYRVVKYNILLSNIGDAYSVLTGVFSVPHNGTYLVGFSAVSLSGHDVLLHLVRNNQRLLSAYDNSGCLVAADSKKRQCSGMASNAAMLYLNQGDHLWVELPDGYGLHNALYHNYCTFYATLITKD